MRKRTTRNSTCSRDAVAVKAPSACGGVLYSEGRHLPQYLPVDEAHPALADDYYGLSKIINEQTALAFAQRSAMTVVCLRLTNVLNFNRSTASGRDGSSGSRLICAIMTCGPISSIFQEDAARAFRLAVEQPLEGHHVIN